MTTRSRLAPSCLLLNKVPEVTVYFWIVKMLCTTVGESAADFLNVNLGFGLTGTSVVTGVLLVVALIFQFRASRYVPGVYWSTVALVSVFGTLVTDNLADNVGVPLETSTLIFSALLALTFIVWYSSERTLSIHSILTRRREAFYWLAILFTFALGTATGDLMAEVLGLGYLVTGIIVASLITIIAIAWRLGLSSVLSFWIIYVLTRPLGASIGDYLSQSQSQGGLGLGTTVTSVIFLLGILGIVIYLSIAKVDVLPATDTADAAEEGERGGLWQTIVVLALVLVVAGGGYFVRKSALEEDTSAPAAAAQGDRAASLSSLGDLGKFREITQNTLDLLNAGNQAGATTRVDDLETEWDDAEARLKPKDNATWRRIDGKIDAVLRQLRSTSPDPNGERAALTALLADLG
ncbi:COG4705 family protein [Saccharopolyspora sp. NPDC003752]